MIDLKNITSKTKVVRSLRAEAERYGGSSRVDDTTQSDTLYNIANSILRDDIEEAVLYFSALHINIRNGLTFDVLDYMGQAENHLSSK